MVTCFEKTFDLGRFTPHMEQGLHVLKYVVQSSLRVLHNRIHKLLLVTLLPKQSMTLDSIKSVLHMCVCGPPGVYPTNAPL